MTTDQTAMLNECLDADRGLTAWELGFIEDLDRNWRDSNLSPKQAEKLAQINEKVLDS